MELELRVKRHVIIRTYYIPAGSRSVNSLREWLSKDNQSWGKIQLSQKFDQAPTIK